MPKKAKFSPPKFSKLVLPVKSDTEGVGKVQILAAKAKAKAAIAKNSAAANQEELVLFPEIESPPKPAAESPNKKRGRPKKTETAQQEVAAKQEKAVKQAIILQSNLSRREKEELLMLLAEKRRREETRQCRESCEYFITQHVRIEDRDEAIPALDDVVDSAEYAEYVEKPDGIAVPFALWEGQKGVLQAFLKKRLLIVLKARQLGLSWLALAYAVWRMRFFPGFQVVALSKRETPDAKELVRRVKFILRYLPEFLIREKSAAPKDWNGPTWEATTLTITIHHPEKEPSVFTSMSSSPDSGRSFTANLVILDEWAFQPWAEEIWAAVYPTINRPTGGQVIGISTARILTLFEEMWRGAVAGKNGFHPIFLPWRTDPRRDEAWYEATKANFPHSYLQEYPATPEEAFSIGEGTAFPEFREDIHVCDDFEPPPHWKRWRSCDNGYDDPFAWYWFAVSEDGQVFIYREFTREPDQPKLTYSEQARKVRDMSVYLDSLGVRRQEACMYTVAGLDAWATHHRDQMGKTLIDYYAEGGIVGFIPAITDRKLRKAVWHEYLRPYYDENTGKMTAKVQICRSCQKLIETLPHLPKDEKDPEKVADCTIDHWYDGAGYGLLAYHVKRSKSEEKPLTGDAKRIHDHIESLVRDKKRKVKRYAF